MPKIVNPKRLTKKEKEFVDKYLEIGNATKAYAQVYKCGSDTDKQIGQKAWHKKQLPHIVKEIETRQNKISKKVDYDLEKAIEGLDSIISAISISKMKTNEALNLTLKVLQEKNKLLGLYSPQTHLINSQQNVVIQIIEDKQDAEDNIIEIGHEEE